MLKPDDFKAVFAVAGLIGVLLIASPTLNAVLNLPRGERFSEFWVLGPNHMAEDYPFNIDVNKMYRVFVGLGNHMGDSSYYLIYVKFRNQTQPLPNVTSSEASTLPPLYEYRVFLIDSETWEAPLTFSVLEASRNEDYMFVDRLSINDAVFVVNVSTKWDSEHNGFRYQLFFELWLYDVTSQSFQFHNRFVGIWLNVTA